MALDDCDVREAPAEPAQRQTPARPYDSELAWARCFWPLARWWSGGSTLCPVGSDDLVDDLARSARDCAALRNAVVLADWVGTGRAVTAKRVLRRADVPVAGRALGIELPGRVRSAADVPALHWPWMAALGAGLLSIDGGRAVSSALAGWQAARADEVLDLWSRSFVMALTSLFDSDEESEALEIGRLALTVLASEPAPTHTELASAISHVVFNAGYELYRAFDRGFGVHDPAEVTLELLATFGAVTDTPERRITPLGRWALSMIGARGVSLLGSSDDVEEDGTYQLKIALQHVQPACWRRVHIPASATLGELHEVIQVAFAWDGDHLHAFTVGRRQYGDPSFDAEYDEHEITLAAAFARARKPITYTYDFGADWRHEITQEKLVEPTPNATHPICVDGRGDAPLEDCGDDEPAWIAFDKAGINTRLARLGSGGQEAEARLRDDIEVILTDAYGEAEQLTAFQTVWMRRSTSRFPPRCWATPSL
ncbi:plasmid pRiA4b ORF-3 family protein [Saccharopolyspora shandongensis]|uniref:plasmid pRiA4b ORF-3 family protein n=1 Tax=Saccharopolyspora shandongensis TaxID=418495 RepID=UPI0033F89D83